MGRDNEEWRRQHPLLVQLRELSRKEGIWRKDLRSLFAAELPDLCAAWNLDLQSLTDEALRNRVHGRLMEHLKEIPTPARTWTKNAEKRKQQFRMSFGVGFNLSGTPSSVPLNTRQNRASGVKPKMAQRDLAYACEQIETQILADGYRPIVVIELVELKPEDALDYKEEKAASSALMVLRPLKREVWAYPSEPRARSRKAMKRAFTLAAAVVLEPIPNL